MAACHGQAPGLELPPPTILQSQDTAHMLRFTCLMGYVTYVVGHTHQILWLPSVTRITTWRLLQVVLDFGNVWGFGLLFEAGGAFGTDLACRCLTRVTVSLTLPVAV